MGWQASPVTTPETTPPAATTRNVGDLAEVLGNLGVFSTHPEDLIAPCASGFRRERAVEPRAPRGASNPPPCQSDVDEDRREGLTTEEREDG